jgi:nucleotide-binding universal stress UspA family protein
VQIEGLSTTSTNENTNAGSTEGRIVVGVDGSEGSRRALEWAAVQAVRTGMLLEIHTVYVPGYFFVTPDEVNDIAQKLLDEAAQRAGEVAPGVTTVGKAHHDEAPSVVLIDASEGADLLVVGSRGHGGFRGLVLGSVSQKCSLHAHSPVVIVH